MRVEGLRRTEPRKAWEVRPVWPPSPLKVVVSAACLPQGLHFGKYVVYAKASNTQDKDGYAFLCMKPRRRIDGLAAVLAALALERRRQRRLSHRGICWALGKPSITFHTVSRIRRPAPPSPSPPSPPPQSSRPPPLQNRGTSLTRKCPPPRTTIGP